VNRVLSQARDADAMLETLSKLLDRQPRLLSEHTHARLRLELSNHRDTVARAADREDAWKDVVEELRDVRADVKRWSSAHKRFGALAQGLRATHKRGRKAMVRALESRRAADFHEWRKQMKALWYELRLIEDAGPAIQKDVKRLDEAETLLGDDHNVVVLCAYISSTRSCAFDSSEWQGLCRHAERYQERLRRKAIARAEAIYKTATGAYVRRMKRAWRTGIARAGRAELRINHDRPLSVRRHERMAVAATDLRTGILAATHSNAVGDEEQRTRKHADEHERSAWIERDVQLCRTGA
jgi:CHAD domain